MRGVEWHDGAMARKEKDKKTEVGFSAQFSQSEAGWVFCVGSVFLGTSLFAESPCLAHEATIAWSSDV